MNPAVSIVLPFRNAEATLEECLASISRQTLRDWELIAVDDGSEDGSAQLLLAAAARDPRIRVAQPGRVGLVGALNEGLRRARAPFIARMDADDVMHEERLAAQSEYLGRHPEIAVVGSRVEIFPAERLRAGYLEYLRWQNACVTSEEIATNIYVEAPLAHPTVMFRRHIIQDLGSYREGEFPEDYELWLRLITAGKRIAKLPRVLLRWRDAEDRASRRHSRYRRDAFDRLRARYLASDVRLRRDRALVIWGAGRKTRLRVRYVLERGLQPAAFIDVDPSKIARPVWGVPVRPPEWLAREPRPFVLVYVTNHGARDRIAAKLAEMGYQAGRDFLCVG